MKKLLVALAASLLTAVSSGQAFAQSAILGATSNTSTNGGSVLGATSTLTNTGQNIILSVIVGSVLLFAVVLIVLNNKRKTSLNK